MHTHICSSPCCFNITIRKRRVSVCVLESVRINVHVQVYDLHVSVLVLYACVQVSVYECIITCACAYVCLRVCVCAWVTTFTVCMHLGIYMCLHMCECTLVYKHTRIHNICPCTHIFKHIRKHIYIN